MLNPIHDRSQYTSIFIPPTGTRFDEAIATTYSLDLSVLLEAPVYLNKLALDGQSVNDHISIMRATKNYSKCISVFVQNGGIKFPDSISLTPVFRYLEDMVHEISIDSKGVFHPKIWIIRFKSEENCKSYYRLIVLSRNITKDRSWDVSLQLDGIKSGKLNENNIPLSEFVRKLPKWCYPKLRSNRQASISKFSDDIRYVKWKSPEHFKAPKFYFPGIQEYTWNPPKAKDVLVISPFCKREALEILKNQIKRPTALISRPQTLSELEVENIDTLRSFKYCYVLRSGEENGTMSSNDKIENRDTFGLHAKLYVYETLKRSVEYTHFIIGSANATNAALKNRENIEILVELEGRKDSVGGIKELFEKEGLSEYIEKYEEGNKIIDDSHLNAEKVIDDARRILIKSKFIVECSSKLPSGQRELTLKGVFPVLKGIKSVTVWPITVDESEAQVLPMDNQDSSVSFGKVNTWQLTNFIAFKLTTNDAEISALFVRKLGHENFPSERERDNAISREIFKGPKDFVNYIYQFFVENSTRQIDFRRNRLNYLGGYSFGKGLRDPALMEELVKILCRNRERLDEISNLIEDLSTGTDKSFLPDGFPEFWDLIKNAKEKQDAKERN